MFSRGKTRLALEVAAGLREWFADAVWFVPLVDLADPLRLVEQVRDALRLPRAPGADPLEQLVTVDRPRPWSRRSIMRWKSPDRAADGHIRRLLV